MSPAASSTGSAAPAAGDAVVAGDDEEVDGSGAALVVTVPVVGGGAAVVVTVSVVGTADVVVRPAPGPEPEPQPGSDAVTAATVTGNTSARFHLAVTAASSQGPKHDRRTAPDPAEGRTPEPLPGVGHADHAGRHLPLLGLHLLGREPGGGDAGLLVLFRPPVGGLGGVVGRVEPLEEVLRSVNLDGHVGSSFGSLQFGDGARHGVGQSAEAVPFGHQAAVVAAQRAEDVGVGVEGAGDVGQPDAQLAQHKDLL